MRTRPVTVGFILLLVGAGVAAAAGAPKMRGLSKKAKATVEKAQKIGAHPELGPEVRGTRETPGGVVHERGYGNTLAGEGKNWKGPSGGSGSEVSEYEGELQPGVRGNSISAALRRGGKTDVSVTTATSGNLVRRNFSSVTGVTRGDQTRVQQREERSYLGGLVRSEREVNLHDDGKGNRTVTRNRKKIVIGGVLKIPAGRARKGAELEQLTGKPEAAPAAEKP